ncbi:MAG: S8 family serine peptidase [Actinomycetota bacterium]|nr:S8 family serine peptidase [Actinomycetota bacterium]
MTRPLSAVLFAALAAALLLPASAPARGGEPIQGQYIVVFKGSVGDANQATDDQERAQGFRAKYRYDRALKGFTARLSAQQVDRLKSDPRVAFVTQDRVVHALGAVASGETVPTGVRRIQAASTTTAQDASSVSVAVIDTGIDLANPDLNVASGTNCVNPGAAAQDDNGHGTHVSGTIAAKNTGSGVVGVAPGTQLYAAKVLNAQGSGTVSQVVCGIDWVTANAAALKIKVANMSLGGTGSPFGTCASTTDAEYKAICNSTAAGVTYVVAAGNSGWDFDYAPAPDVPAAYPEALTVTAMSDSDGQPGATGGAPACRTTESDDRYASFSNYALTAAGQSHTIAGPGVCIYSDWTGGGFNTISGTSMATPHLTGSVALCLGQGGAAGPCTGLTPAQIVQKMRSDAADHTTANPSYGFTGDPLHPVGSAYFGYLAWDGAPGSGGGPPPPPPPPPTTTVTAAPGGTTVQTGSYRGGSAASLAAADSAYYSVNSTSNGTRTSAWYGSFTGVPSTLSNLKVTYQGNNSRTCSQTVAIYRFSDGTWVTLDSRNVGTADVRIANLAPGGAPASYVSSGGELRVRVRCTNRSSFYSSGNQLQIVYDRP